ncbi:MAG: UDP-N-acetylmuramoyl-tripeptide--D-alanyl-D-alanine ligase [Candidatus Coatesbacteria bacterium]|nr:MAG: UDP-N-acetylmuramoyl-tripeptide--D-alanyl-D-alanine ligase [Candidatus Coatesbacteria bacterium]
MVYTLKYIAEVVHGRVDGDASAAVSGFAVDSRAVRPGDMFVALPGGRVDGHDFAGAAAEAGAAAAMVSRPVEVDVPLVTVDDPLAAFLALAAERRARFTGPVVAVTGSCGKTTTKDFVAHVLSQAYNVCASPGNYNTEVGLPLSILALENDDEVLVVELGVSAPGDMELLGPVAAPSVAVFTCVAPTHIEFFKSVEAVAEEKLKLLEYVKSDGTVIWNADDGMLARVPELGPDGVRTVSYGFSGDADVFAARYEPRGFAGSFFVLNGETPIELPIPGRFNVYNALAAAAVAGVLGVEAETTADAIRTVPTGEMRTEVVERGGVTYVLDCYNSSPRAAAEALDMLAEAASGRRTVAVLGEMLEMGEISDEEHRRLGKRALEHGIDVIVGLGAGGALIIEGAREAGFEPDTTYAFETHGETGAFLDAFLKEGDTVLLKASRGVRMELVARELGLDA